MANSRRVSRISSLIKREISNMLLFDIKDDRVGAGMISITNVYLSGDLQHVKIFVSIYGTEELQLETMQGLRSSEGYVRKELAQRIRLRRAPDVQFFQDHSIEKGNEMLHLLNELRDTDTTEQDASSLI
ncbi:MAG: 30S ribosome-binding factor RbfA [Candidatus Atelocyanobacterium thalassa]|uniref:Ribosome-binding factor A n=1 Tax=Candidatus Atelocyanobacterium thalassa isolate SIO64986 TaxID=1527444 RepID=A0A086CGY5_9CHRO|nr:MAG: ribosome-binding factor A [Candidatus Atelocyanobacterium thalassa isolate SIO64986]